MYFPLVEAGHLPDSEFLGNLAGYLLFLVMLANLEGGLIKVCGWVAFRKYRKRNVRIAKEKGK